MNDTHNKELAIGDDVACYGGWHYMFRGTVVGFTEHKVRVMTSSGNLVTNWPFHTLRLGVAAVKPVEQPKTSDGVLITIPSIPDE